MEPSAMCPKLVLCLDLKESQGWKSIERLVNAHRRTTGHRGSAPSARSGAHLNAMSHEDPGPADADAAVAVRVSPGDHGCQLSPTLLQVATLSSCLTTSCRSCTSCTPPSRSSGRGRERGLQARIVEFVLILLLDLVFDNDNYRDLKELMTNVMKTTFKYQHGSCTATPHRTMHEATPMQRCGTDSRLGFGFRFGPHADAQVVLELGPQRRTEPLTVVTTQQPTVYDSKRHVSLDHGQPLQDEHHIDEVVDNHLDDHRGRARRQRSPQSDRYTTLSASSRVNVPVCSMSIANGIQTGRKSNGRVK
ncbi:hypothetical protein FOCC_FOCC001890 [Frankliniella occidentalis]|nr:hypothetical protein FOCC_FOCC001890 [Frankliniella occidentalis]